MNLRTKNPFEATKAYRTMKSQTWNTSNISFLNPQNPERKRQTEKCVFFRFEVYSACWPKRHTQPTYCLIKMLGLIDLNTVEEDEPKSQGATLSLSSSSSSSSLSSSAVNAPNSNENSSSPCLSPSLVSLDLWHACSGPRILLPTKGTSLVYLPQGQMELAGDLPAAACYDLPPHIFCRVVDVKLHVSERDSIFLSRVWY